MSSPSISFRPARVGLLPTLGDAFTLEATFTDADGAPVDMSGVDQCRMLKGTTVIDLDSRIARSGDNNEVVTVTVTAADVSTLTASSGWRWLLADSTAKKTWLDGPVTAAPAGSAGVTSPTQSVAVTVTDASAATISVTVTAGGSGGSGTGLPDGGTTGQILAKASGTDGDYEFISRNAPDGYAGLDGDGTLPDILHPASIARDTEVTAAVAAEADSRDTAIAAAVGAIRGTLYANLRLTSDVGVSGGAFDFTAFGPLPAGVTINLVDQPTASDNGIYVNDGAGHYTLTDDQPYRPERAGTLLTIGFDVTLFSSANYGPTLYMVVSPDGGTTWADTPAGGVAFQEAHPEVYLAKHVIELCATDGSATTVQVINREDGAPGSGTIPAQWVAKGSPVPVADLASQLVVQPPPDSGTAWTGKLLRVAASGAWTELDPPIGRPILVTESLDSGAAQWWYWRYDHQPWWVETPTHAVRRSHYDGDGFNPTLAGWHDQNEVNGVLANQLEWYILTWTIDFTWDEPRQWQRGDATPGNIVGTLPALADALIGREYRAQKVDASANTVTIKDADGGTVVVLSTEGELVNCVTDGTSWFYG